MKRIRTQRRLLRLGGLLTLVVALAAPSAYASGVASLADDIYRGPDTSWGVDLTDAGGTLYLRAEARGTGSELFRSDGTPKGTRLVKDIVPGAEGSAPRHFTHMDGVVYFSASALETGDELWRTDGTALGTRLVREFVPGGRGVGDSAPRVA